MNSLFLLSVFFNYKISVWFFLPLILFWGFQYFHLFPECSWLLLGAFYNSWLKKKKVSDNSNASVILTLAIVDYHFQCELRFPFFRCCQMLDCILFKYYREYWYSVSGRFRLQVNSAFCGIILSWGSNVNWAFKTFASICPVCALPSDQSVSWAVIYLGSVITDFGCLLVRIDPPQHSWRFRPAVDMWFPWGHFPELFSILSLFGSFQFPMAHLFAPPPPKLCFSYLTLL